MSPTKAAPKRNVIRRRARREAEHRRRERTFWSVWFFGWVGLLYAWVTNAGERAQQERFEEQVRRRRDPALEEEAHGPAARAGPAPHARTREERAALRKAATRRRLVRTVLVVGAVLLLYVAYMWVRFEMGR